MDVGIIRIEKNRALGVDRGLIHQRAIPRHIVFAQQRLSQRSVDGRRIACALQQRLEHVDGLIQRVLALHVLNESHRLRVRPLIRSSERGSGARDPPRARNIERLENAFSHEVLQRKHLCARRRDRVSGQPQVRFDVAK